MALLRSTLLGLCVIGALSGSACGSDPAAPQGDSKNDDDDDKDAKKDAGKGKDAGKESDAGKKDAGAASAAKTVECGSKTCKGTAVMGFSTTPCCFDEEEEICSVYPPPASDGECPEPAKLSDKCPSVMVVVQEAKGCCTADNHCGIDATMLGMGCADLASPQLQSTLSGFGVTVPPPQTCDGEPLEPTTPAPTDAGKPSTTGDAGKSDAGASSSSDAGKSSSDAGKADAGK